MTERPKNILVTGGAGFIGSHLVDTLLAHGHCVIVLDLLTYAGAMTNLAGAQTNAGFAFVHGDICNTELVSKILRDYRIDWVAHLAAETHVDNSIDAPAEFIRTNLVGTGHLLQAALDHFKKRKPDFRFLHVSTDEVFGQLTEREPRFTEATPYRPNSPYSASKAGSDHLVRAWFHTYGLPVIITNCTNNYGPRQHREKLIPTMISAALENRRLPVYGNGRNIRDWLHVADHCEGLRLALANGTIGETYCFGGDCEIRNINLVIMLCRTLDEIAPRKCGGSYANLISFVRDRPGHDWRYAIDCRKAKREIGFQPRADFALALRETVAWYVEALGVREP